MTRDNIETIAAHELPEPLHRVLRAVHQAKHPETLPDDHPGYQRLLDDIQRAEDAESYACGREAFGQRASFADHMPRAWKDGYLDAAMQDLCETDR